MSDPIESAPTEITLPKGIVLGKTGTTVLISFATYGALSATRDAVSFTKKIIRKRKAIREAAEKADRTPATEQ